MYILGLETGYLEAQSLAFGHYSSRFNVFHIAPAYEHRTIRFVFGTRSRPNYIVYKAASIREEEKNRMTDLKGTTFLFLQHGPDRTVENPEQEQLRWQLTKIKSTKKKMSWELPGLEGYSVKNLCEIQT